MRFKVKKLFVLLYLFPSIVFAQTWHGYECTVDCGGHREGYKWAERKSIDDIWDCRSNSNSFSEGCAEYVKEQKRDTFERKRSDIQDEIDDLQNQIDDLDSDY